MRWTWSWFFMASWWKAQIRSNDGCGLVTGNSKSRELSPPKSQIFKKCEGRFLYFLYGNKILGRLTDLLCGEGRGCIRKVIKGAAIRQHSTCLLPEAWMQITNYSSFAFDFRLFSWQSRLLGHRFLTSHKYDEWFMRTGIWPKNIMNLTHASKIIPRILLLFSRISFE